MKLSRGHGWKYNSDTPGSKFFSLGKDRPPKKDQYFNKIFDIVEETGLSWLYLDLLFIRETKLENVKQMWEDQNFHNFFQIQLEISKKIIELATPSILVVINTFSRDILKTYTKIFAFVFDNILGTYTIENHATLNGTPVFFSGMLSGQRALDLGSFERLIWHIQYVKKLRGIAM